MGARGRSRLARAQGARLVSWRAPLRAASVVVLQAHVAACAAALLWHLAPHLLCDDRRRREAGGGRWLGRAGGAARAAALSVALTLAVALALAVTLALGPKPRPHLHLHKVPFSAPTSLDIGSTAWRTSTQNDKSSATRLREAAPTAVQFALQQVGL